MYPDLDPPGEAADVTTSVPIVETERAPFKVRVTSAPFSMIATLIAFDSLPGFLAAHLNVFAVAPA